ncbi:MAG: MFS transporter [Candidatus Neomarinimicrobiota bacterium]|nr:MAG: MFS transporter [Candidatus Neomarinimicrobiota bacterium]
MERRINVVFCAVVAALGGFLFGFDTAVISGAEESIQEIFGLTDFWHGFTVAIALIGTMIGAIEAAKPADKFGRKKTLIIIALLYSVSAVGSALSENWYSFLFYRFIGGLGVGASSVVGPMYIAEISPFNRRGRLVALFQLNVVTGILASFFSNYLLLAVGENAWRWMLGVEFFPAFVFFILIFFIPNTPRWLVRQKRIADAEDVLVRLGETNVKSEMDEIVDSLTFELSAAKERLFQKKYSLPILYAVLIALFNQLSGINAIMYYAPRIFELSGVVKNYALLQAVAIGFTNLIFTVIAMSIIDKFGRKNLLIIGSIGTMIFLGLVARTFYLQKQSNYGVMLYLIGFIAFFAFSQGTVIWVFISEIFPNKIRAKGQALGAFTHWAGAAIISWTFPVVANSKLIGPGNSFMFFSVMMILQFLFVLKFLPETKGKSLEQIEKDLKITK